MTHYYIVSPEMYEKIDIGLDDGTGPLEYFRCGCSVDAPNKRAAKIIAIKHPALFTWVKQCRRNRTNPFVGLEVLNPICSHGVCLCELCQPIECQKCLGEEWK